MPCAPCSGLWPGRGFQPAIRRHKWIHFRRETSSPGAGSCAGQPLPAWERPWTPAAVQNLANPPSTRRDAAPPAQGQPYLSVARGADPRAITQAALAAIGGIERFVHSGDDVIIKPNICVDYRSYEYGATTNPEVVAALVELCLGAGAKSCTGDGHSVLRHGGERLRHERHRRSGGSGRWGDGLMNHSQVPPGGDPDSART